MIIAGFASTQIKTLSGVFILISAIIGVTLFQFAPKIAKRLFKKEKKHLFQVVYKFAICFKSLIA